MTNLAVLAVHVGVLHAELLPGLAHPDTLPHGHEDSSHSYKTEIKKPQIWGGGFDGKIWRKATGTAPKIPHHIF